MKILRTMLSVMLVAAVLMTMVLSANAYTLDGQEKTGSAAGDVYVYDWKTGDTWMNVSAFTGHQGTAATLTNSTDGTFKRITTNWPSNYYPRYNSGLPIAGSYCEVALVDGDFTLGADPNAAANSGQNGLKVETGHIYEITVEWTASQTSGYYMFIVANYNNAADGSLKGETYFIPNALKEGDSYNYLASNKNNGYAYQKTTFIVDADAEYTIQNSSGSTETHTAAGRYLGLSGTGNQNINFKQVTVKVIDKAAVEAENAKKEQLYNYSNADVALNFNGGLNDLYMPNTRNGNNELLDCEIVKDGSNKYLKVTNKMRTGMTVNIGFAAAAGRGEFADMGVTASKAAEGYQLTAGTKYAVSYDFYVEKRTGNFAAGSMFYITDASTIGTSSASGEQSLENLKNGTTDINDGAADGKWVTVSYTFTASKSGYGAIAWKNITGRGDSDDWASIFYIDNIVVREVKGDGVLTNTARSIRTASGEGKNYVAAGLRLRGNIWGGTANNAEVGFIVAPEVLADAYGADWYVMDANGNTNYEYALKTNVTAKEYNGNTDPNTTWTYQVLINKLTKENDNNNLLGVNFDVMLYVLKNGEYTYYTLGTASYNEVNATYILAD